jgi:excisionase family DNA binding protein
MCSDNIIVKTDSLAMSSSSKRTYTVMDIAAILQISKSKAYELCREGQFKAIKVGRSVRVSRLSFDDWLDKQ